MITIPEKVQKELLKGATEVAILDGVLSTENSYYNNYKVFNPTHFMCGCEKGNGKIQKFKDKYNSNCEFCGKTISIGQNLYSKDANEKDIEANKWHRNSVSSKKTESVVYIASHEEYEAGIKIFIGHVVSTLIYDEEQKNVLHIKREPVISYYGEYVPGVKAEAYKVLKRSNKPVDFFELFNINSQNISFRHCYYEDSKDVFEFLDKNQKFSERSGILEAFKNFIQRIDPNAFFVLHIALVTEYPVLELLIKMKYTKLYFDIVNEVMRSESKVAIKDNVKELNKLLNQTTKGALALKIPQYIGNYLREKAAPLNEYINWCDIYDLENISKENFEKIINSSYFFDCLANYSLQVLPNIMKYGYDFEKLLRYLQKAERNYKDDVPRYYRNNYGTIANLLKDYLEMCDLMDIKPDKTPVDIQKAHDTVAKAYKAKENEIQDMKFKEISDSVMRCIAPREETKDGKKKELTKVEKLYEVVVPASTRDFINEGQQQHNCVGSYTRSVLNGHCIIFFIRKRENPEESFITAEYRKNGTLGQVMYKNNLWVDDKEIIDYCNVICNKIKRGINNKEIVI